MDKLNHTPGKWQANDSHNIYPADNQLRKVERPHGNMVFPIAHVFQSSNREEDEANERLIIAAPLMFEALQKIAAGDGYFFKQASEYARETLAQI